MRAASATTRRAVTAVTNGDETPSPTLLPQTMRAVVQAEFGSAVVLHVEEIDRPTIGDDEALIRVHAAGMDRGTWHLMAGRPYMFRLMGGGLRTPRTSFAGSTSPARSWPRAHK